MAKFRRSSSSGPSSSGRDGSADAAGAGAGAAGTTGVAGIPGASSPTSHFGGSLWYRLLTSLLLYGLIIEWLLPWMHAEDWSEVYQFGPLLVVVGCILGAGLFQLPWGLSLLVQASICILTVMWLFQGSEQSSLAWLMALPRLIWDDVRLLFQVGMWSMSGELRTLLLFAGWAMLAPALQALIWMRQLALGLAAITAAYLLVLDIWLGMNVLDGLVRTAVEGLLLAMLTAVPRAQRLLGEDTYNASGSRRQGRGIAAPLLLILMLIGAGMLLANGRPESNEPASWTGKLTNRLEEAVSNMGDGTSSGAELKAGGVGSYSFKTGYGFDDSQLGEALERDERVILIGSSPVRTYWRGESKSVYDGRGWQSSDSLMSMLPVQDEEQGGGRQVQGAVDSGRKITQSVKVAAPAAGMPLFSGSDRVRVKGLIGADPRRSLDTYILYKGNGAIYPPSDKVKVESYTLDVTLPVTDAAALRASSGTFWSGLRGETTSESVGVSNSGLGVGADEASQSTQKTAATLSVTELKPYLQLPKSLPSRVVALASEVSGGGVTSRYDQVKAVETYLRSNYKYTLTESKVPPAGADFADDFLFEQKQGYCAHFSTAMVVMLRSQGIPARWVKGYASGTLLSDGKLGGSGLAGDESDEAGGVRLAEYEIRAKDAHAWVEVYFDGIGWVPFDPTPGFAGVIGAAAAAPAGTAGGGSAQPAGTHGSAALGEAASAAAAPAARPDGLSGRAQALLEAAEDAAASGVARVGEALAQAARSAAGAAAGAEPAAVSAAGAAALALAAAALAIGQRERLRLALALRRYRAAYTAAEAAVTAPLQPRTRLRNSYIQAANLIWPQLHRRIGGRSPDQSAREYAASVALELSPERIAALQQFVAWDDSARYGRPDYWAAPTPQELEAAAQQLCGPRRRVVAVNKSASTNQGSPILPSSNRPT
ncbi:DUF4129 domain-containing transglutaminase family protein [Paenibacillus sp. GCM10023252]|uniref:DUF4129 domain-containing transglutaminase family protein n=1 Tax=Paenibacillus sp. GCM10023252 TaxID=3252649 RepID=UPI00361EFFC6